MNVLAALGICAVHQFFTAAERVTEACLDVTQTVASVSFATAEEMVRAVDG